MADRPKRRAVRARVPAQGLSAWNRRQRLRRCRKNVSRPNCRLNRHPRNCVLLRSNGGLVVERYCAAVRRSAEA